MNIFIMEFPAMDEYRVIQFEEDKNFLALLGRTFLVYIYQIIRSFISRYYIEHDQLLV